MKKLIFFITSQWKQIEYLFLLFYIPICYK